MAISAITLPQFQAATIGDLTGYETVLPAYSTVFIIDTNSVVVLDGGAFIPVTAAAGTLTGATLAAGVTASSLTSLGTIANLNFTAIQQGIPAINMLDGILNGNTARQSQVTSTNTSYYITSSNLNLPATLKAGMIVGTKFVWRVHMTKTAAGTGTFSIILYRGTNGSTSDTADVTQSIGTQTAAVDNMIVDVTLIVTTTGASGAYFWSICPVQRAASAAGFGIATGTTGLFTGTVSGVAMNTTSLIFGLGFRNGTPGTPTISVPLVTAQAFNIN